MIQQFKVRMSPGASELVCKTLDSGFIGQGPRYDELEEKLGLEFGKKPILTNSCTSALSLSLALAGVSYGDYVISTPQTCLASNSSIVERGGRILWADVDPITGNICPDSVASLLEENMDLPIKAIMAVNWAGRLCNYHSLKSHGIPVIEDAAHCMIDPRGNNHGDYIAYSLQAIKFLTSGDGGILFTPEDKFDLAYKLNWYGLDRRTGSTFRCVQDVETCGFKYHMNDIAASIALANYDLAKQSLIDHRNNAKYFTNRLRGVSSVTLPPWSDDCDYWLYSLLIEKGTKEQFIEHLADNGIVCNPVHRRNDTFTCLKKFKEGYRSPGLNNFSSKQVSIPVGFWLTDKEKEHIVEVIKNY